MSDTLTREEKIQKMIAQLNHISSSGLQPHLTILLDVPSTQGLKQAKQAKQGHDRMEKAGTAFHKKVRAGFLVLAKKEPKRFRVIRQQATVALGGDGGDELFGGYHHYEWVRRQELVRRFIPSPLRSMISSAARMLPSGLRGRNYLVGSARDLDWSMAHVNLYFDLPARRALLAPSGMHIDESPELEKMGFATGSTATQRSMAMDFRTYLPDDILVKVDRASMLTSLEVRAPLLDPAIIEFAFGKVPDHLRAGKRQRKVLLKKLAGRLLPPELDITRKQGFSIPLALWFKGPWGTYMRQILHEADPRLFDQRTIESFISGEDRGLVNSHRLFALTFFELWRREYNVSF